MKTKRITILVEPEVYDQIVKQSAATGVPYAEAGRRLFDHWLETGKLPEQTASPTKARRGPKPKPK